MEMMGSQMSEEGWDPSLFFGSVTECLFVDCVMELDVRLCDDALVCQSNCGQLFRLITSHLFLIRGE